jgi:hypothetical protein
MMLSIWFKTTVDFSCGFLDCIFIEVGCITEGSIGQIDIEVWISSCLFVREVRACSMDPRPRCAFSTKLGGIRLWVMAS